MLRAESGAQQASTQAIQECKLFMHVYGKFASQKPSRCKQRRRALPTVVGNIEFVRLLIQQGCIVAPLNKSREIPNVEHTVIVTASHTPQINGGAAKKMSITIVEGEAYHEANCRDASWDAHPSSMFQHIHHNIRSRFSQNWCAKRAEWDGVLFFVHLAKGMFLMHTANSRLKQQLTYNATYDTVVSCGK